MFLGAWAPGEPQPFRKRSRRRIVSESPAVRRSPEVPDQGAWANEEPDVCHDDGLGDCLGVADSWRIRNKRKPRVPLESSRISLAQY